MKNRLGNIFYAGIMALGLSTAYASIPARTVFRTGSKALKKTLKPSEVFLKPSKPSFKPSIGPKNQLLLSESTSKRSSTHSFLKLFSATVDKKPHASTLVTEVTNAAKSGNITFSKDATAILKKNLTNHVPARKIVPIDVSKPIFKSLGQSILQTTLSSSVPRPISFKVIRHGEGLKLITDNLSSKPAEAIHLPSRPNAIKQPSRIIETQPELVPEKQKIPNQLVVRPRTDSESNTLTTSLIFNQKQRTRILRIFLDQLERLFRADDSLGRLPQKQKINPVVDADHTTMVPIIDETLYVKFKTSDALNLLRSLQNQRHNNEYLGSSSILPVEIIEQTEPNTFNMLTTDFIIGFNSRDQKLNIDISTDFSDKSLTGEYYSIPELPHKESTLPLNTAGQSSFYIHTPHIHALLTPTQHLPSVQPLRIKLPIIRAFKPNESYSLLAALPLPATALKHDSNLGLDKTRIELDHNIQSLHSNIEPTNISTPGNETTDVQSSKELNSITLDPIMPTRKPSPVSDHILNPSSEPIVHSEKSQFPVEPKLENTAETINPLGDITVNPKNKSVSNSGPTPLSKTPAEDTNIVHQGEPMRLNIDPKPQPTQNPTNSPVKHNNNNDNNKNKQIPEQSYRNKELQAQGNPLENIQKSPKDFPSFPSTTIPQQSKPSESAPEPKNSARNNNSAPVKLPPAPHNNHYDNHYNAPTRATTTPVKDPAAVVIGPLKGKDPSYQEPGQTSPNIERNYPLAVPQSSPRRHLSSHAHKHDMQAPPALLTPRHEASTPVSPNPVPEVPLPTSSSSWATAGKVGFYIIDIAMIAAITIRNRWAQLLRKILGLLGL